jgi:hypothetical protein
MIVATLILILSMALFFFYFQVICQKILRRPFEREYYRSIANAHRLEFPTLRISLEEAGAKIDYSRLRRALECDFLALTYLLKNAANVKQRYSYEERLLILYFHWECLSLVVRRSLRLGENPVILRLTSILQYFANVVGQRVDSLKLGDLTAAG